MALHTCRYLVQEARALGHEVIDRCNLTVLLEPGQEQLAQFLADNKVHCATSASAHLLVSKTPSLLHIMLAKLSSVCCKTLPLLPDLSMRAAHDCKVMLTRCVASGS